jgi:diguanylate cyclase (GGDEF)-like protein
MEGTSTERLQVLAVRIENDKIKLPPVLDGRYDATSVENDSAAVDLIKRCHAFDLIIVDESVPLARRSSLQQVVASYLPHASIMIIPNIEGHCDNHQSSMPDDATPTEHREPSLVLATAAHRVLVVNNDPDTTDCMRASLVEAGFEVITANDNIRGIQAVLRNAPQIVIAEWSIEGPMSGADFCQAVRADETTGFVYLMVLSGAIGKQTLTAAFDAGADDFIASPFDPAELVARVRAASRVVELEIGVNRRKLELHHANAKMAILNDRLQKLATRDGLTGLINRRRALERFDECWQLANRYDLPLTCLMIDIDRFKNVNDTYGHAAGDTILKGVADIMNSSTRSTDVVARLGGEEFLVIAPNTTLEQSMIVTDRILKNTRDATFQCDVQTVSVTVSIGAATACPTITNCEDMLKYADTALYRAKDTGRNRCCCHDANLVLENPLVTA